MNQSAVLLFLALFAGAIIPIQTSLNAGLSRHLQNTGYSTLAVFSFATLTIATIMLLKQDPFPGVQKFTSVSIVQYFGGLIGLAYIFIVTWLAPKIGVGPTTGFVVVGQVVAAVVIDHYGWLNVPQITITWQRALGIVLMLAGLFLIKKQ